MSSFFWRIWGSRKNDLKMGCRNVKLFLREPLVSCQARNGVKLRSNFVCLQDATEGE